MKGLISYLLELDSSSVPLLQENVGLGAAFGLHSITIRPFFAASSLCLTGLNSNEGAPSDNTKHQHWVTEFTVHMETSFFKDKLIISNYMPDANPLLLNMCKLSAKMNNLHHINKEGSTVTCISIHPF